MLIALLSDTHDNQSQTQTALDLLALHQPEVYLHAGDMVSPDMLPLFAGLSFHFVFGNNEYDHAALRSLAASLDLHCHDYFADLTFAGKRFAVLHGHQDDVMRRALRPAPSFAPKNPRSVIPPAPDSRPFDYIIHGHTHVRRDERAGNAARSRIINPGAVHRAATKSVAILDTAKDALTFLNL